MAERWTRQGNCAGGWKKFMGHDPEDRTLGIVGLGAIGKALALRVKPLRMKVLYHNRNRLSEDVEKEHNATYVTKDELLAKADFISMHTPLNASTRHFLTKTEFDKMKDGVYIINTARGAVIEEQALVDALKSGKVAGAGLDVFENEPEIHPDLKTIPNVCLTPHIGTATIETRTRMEQLSFDNMLAVLEGKKPLTPVNEDLVVQFNK